jgi:hypothetical protein
MLFDNLWREKVSKRDGYLCFFCPAYRSSPVCMRREGGCIERTRNLPNAPIPSLVIHLMAALVATVAEGPIDPTPRAWMRLLVAKDLLIQPVM